ncbi:MAG: hypothetical protein CSA23_03430 [Deltaproteobacteria bacterium]|nr:MAG: hypothetical protein CSA23_03430 [Deltaproteobacteria bacterium]
MTRDTTKHRWTHEWQREGHRVIECEVCGYRHLHPLPDDTKLEVLYKEQYHQDKGHIDYQAVNEDFIARQIEGLQANRELRHIHEQVEDLIPEGAPLTMIDIGGGNNLLARFFMDKGWNSSVFEPNCEAADYLRKFRLHVIESMFENADFAPRMSYAFINLQFVLEHVLNPLDMLRQSVRFLVEGGLIRVCVPNDFSPGQMVWLGKTKMDPPWISYPDHINYFDFESLKRLIERAGLVEVARDTSFPLEFLLLTGNDYYSDERFQDHVGQKVSGFEAAWLNTGQEHNLTAFYQKLAELGMGRSAVIYARLPNSAQFP